MQNSRLFYTYLQCVIFVLTPDLRFIHYGKILHITIVIRFFSKNFLPVLDMCEIGKIGINTVFLTKNHQNLFMIYVVSSKYRIIEHICMFDIKGNAFYLSTCVISLPRPQVYISNIIVIHAMILL